MNNPKGTFKRKISSHCYASSNSEKRILMLETMPLFHDPVSVTELSGGFS
jgi:hypothetical protein